jgi:uncharacterized protein YecE (DUF72 family)
MVFSVRTSDITATGNQTVTGAHVGTSGWSYPSWRGDFYPEGADPKTFLSFYAQRFDTVELNTTGYRLPAEDQFARWAEQTPPGFTFAVKMPLTRLDRVGTFVERVQALGDRLGPLRVVVQSPRDDGLLAFLQGSLPPELAVAYDFRDESWQDVEDVVEVNDLDAEPFRYVRMREPPYTDDALRELAEKLRPPAFVYFRHENEATAPAYARRLVEILDQVPPNG